MDDVMDTWAANRMIADLQRKLAEKDQLLKHDADLIHKIQRENAALREDITAYKPTWQSGKLPGDGWYWWRYQDWYLKYKKPSICRVTNGHPDLFECEWSGPIQEPEENQ